jgi:hypothetical protein
MFWQQWAGVSSMNHYSPVIFGELGLSGNKAGLLGTDIYGIFKITMTFLMLPLGTEQYGRKALLVRGVSDGAVPSVSHFIPF